MRRVFTLVLLLALGAQGACRRSPAPATTGSSSASPSSVARSSATPTRDFPPDDPELGAASSSSLALGPSPPEAASSERAERLRGLLRGQLPAARLPVIETDQGVAFSPNLYDSLTTEVTHAAAGLASAEKKLSAALSPPIVVSGKLDASALAQRANVMRAAFLRCYQRAYFDDPKLEGKVSLLFVVDRDGAVPSIAVESAPPRSGSLQSCLKARGMAQLFPSAVEASDAKFRLVVTFKVGGP